MNKAFFEQKLTRSISTIAMATKRIIYYPAPLSNCIIGSFSILKDPRMQLDSGAG